MASHLLTIIGNEASPYSRKMRAVLRYRQIPHRWVVRNGPEYVTPPPMPVELLPVLVWHDENNVMRESMVDSTPQIERLEREFSGRSLRNPDAALAFLDALIEDYADEWCTKLMFHYRWADEEGAVWATRHLIRQINPSLPTPVIEQMGATFATRQISRLEVVGAGTTAAPVIRAAYARLLAQLDTLITTRPFLFGARPSAADFALYGQLSQLCLYDPGSAKIAQSNAPRVLAWTQRLEDLSGWRADDGHWLLREKAITALRPLLAEVGATYVPYLLANVAAKDAGQEFTDCEVNGVRWRQKPVNYQVKCLRWLREHFSGLGADDQTWLRDVLAPSGCDALLLGE